jgi:hypothetical protein
MKIARGHGWAALAVLLAACAALLATCSSAPRRPLTGNGAVLWRLGETKGAPVTQVRGRKGDLALLSAAVAGVVAGESEDPRQAPRTGSIVGAMTAAAEGGEIAELRPVVLADGGEIPLAVVSVRGARQDGVPIIEIRARSAERRLVVRTRIELSPDAPVARIETVVKNAGRAAIDGLRVGDHVAWPGEATFAPGVGFAAAPSTAEAPWIGRRGKGVSYALAFPDGGRTVEFDFVPQNPVGAVALAQPEALAPGAYRTYRRSLVIVKGGLEIAARAAWTELGVGLAAVRGALAPIPAWATIEARDAKGRPHVVADAARDGTFALWVPAGRYDIVAQAPGGEDSVAVEAVAGQALQLALTPPFPGVLRFHVADGAGGGIPARLVLRGVSPTPDPRLGPRHLASGADNVVYTATGDGAVELPMGRYLATAAHGVEFSIASAEVEVNEGKGAVFRAELLREFDTPGWISAELHVHAEPSFDSSVSLEDRVTSLLAEDLDFVAATDHNTVTDYGEAIAALGASRRLGSARGVEVTTEDPKLGHFNVWPYPAGAPIPPFAGQTPRSLFAAIRAAAPDALLQVNHPRMKEYRIDYFGLCGLDPKTGVMSGPDCSTEFDTVEVWNGMNNDDMAVTRGNLAEWFDLLAAGRRYTATGGSDSHTLVYQWVGFPRNFVRAQGVEKGAPTAKAVAAAVRAGRVQVGAGPFIALRVEGGEPGDLVRADAGRVRVEAEVRAASWVDVDAIEVWVNGELAAEGALAGGAAGPLRGRLSLRLPVEHDAFVVAVARGDKPMTEVLPYTKLAPFAFTNPVFVDADGDGRFTPPRGAAEGGAADAGPAGPERDGGDAP